MNNLTIYLLSITLLFMGAVFIFRVPVRRDYLRRGRLSVGTSVLQALLFYAYGGFPSLYLPAEWPVSHVNLVLRVIGLTLITSGLAVILVGILRLGLLRSFGRQAGVLRETGFYRVTRNPQVLGCVLYVIGFVILWPSCYALGWGLMFAPIIHIMVLTEEQHLRNTYGEEYERYCSRVPRYLGFPKGRQRGAA
jgi:protein-S-isoprenylcysteine O-methyltransferase Ste14